MNIKIKDQLNKHLEDYKRKYGKLPSGPLNPPSWKVDDIANLFKHLVEHIERLEKENENLDKILTE